MTGETLFRSCCGDARERQGDSAPVLGDIIGRFVPSDVDLPPVQASEVRHPANVARHECGHALVALVVGGSVGNLTLEGQPCAEVRIADGAPWRHRVAVDLAGDAATVGELDSPELAWHVSAVRNCGGGYCDRCNAVRRIVIGLRHRHDDEVIAEYRRIEANLAEFFADPAVRTLVADLAWTLADEGTLTGDEIMDRFGSQIRALEFNI